MEHELNQQNDISLAPEKMSLTLEALDNSSTNQHSAIKYKILDSIDKLRKNKKRCDLNAITEHIGLHKTLTPFGESYLSHQNKGKSIVVPYMEDVIIFPPIETDSVSNVTVPKIAPDLRTPEIKDKRQSKTKPRNSKETQTDFRKFVIVLVLLTKKKYGQNM